MELERKHTWMTIRETAAYLRLSSSYMRKAVRLGQIPYVRLGRGCFTRATVDLSRWKRASEVERLQLWHLPFGQGGHERQPCFHVAFGGV